VQLVNRHGGKAVFIVRLISAVRTLVSIPAGIAGMDLAVFLLYSGAGTVLWATLLAVAGYFLESQYDKVANWLSTVSNVIIGLIVLWYRYRLVTLRRRETR
jgi:membrane protein DedA with SNARE-associated domain